MAPERLYLKDFLHPADAARSLQERIRDASNVASWGPGPNGAAQLRDKYLQWVEETEQLLSSLTLDGAVVTMLCTDRYLYIRGASMDPRPWPLVEAEVRLQAGRLERMVKDLEERARRLSSAPGHITVVDTHVLLHYQPPEQIPWPTLVGNPQVRLVVPLRVVEELDEKKYARRADIADRARRLLPRLEAVLGTAGAPGQLRPGVTIEVPFEPGPRPRPTDADEEVLDTCRELRQLTGREVTLITGDTSMRLRGQARGIPVVKMPDEYLRSRLDAEVPQDAERLAGT
jgi:rRNA-processing protein FCF1